MAPKNDHQLIDDDPDYDMDVYYENTNQESDSDMNWLLTAAGLLGMAMVTKSLDPSGPLESPILADTPISVNTVSDETFSDIMRMNVEPTSLTGDLKALPYGLTDQEFSQYNQLAEELKHQGRLEDPRTIENTSMRWAEERNDMAGMFADLESSKAGTLDEYIRAAAEENAKIMIPWNPTGDNTCEECMALVEDGPYPVDDFPEPPHFGCQCNDPMADPIIVFEK